MTEGNNRSPEMETPKGKIAPEVAAQRNLGKQPRTEKEPRGLWTREDASLTDAIFGGESEQQILAHNKRIWEANEEEQRKTEKLRLEAMKAYEEYQSRLSPQEREARAQAREQRRIRATEKHEGKVVATREEVDARLASENLPPLTDTEWERVMKDDAWREVQKLGTEASHEMYLERKAEEKAEYRRREAMPPDERERERVST